MPDDITETAVVPTTQGFDVRDCFDRIASPSLPGRNEGIKKSISRSDLKICSDLKEYHV